MSTINVNNVQSSTSDPPVFKNSGGTEIGTLCRAWVSFNGTGTVSISDSLNVSSITDNGIGDYSVNFINAMPSRNYCTTLSYTNEVNVAHGVGFITGQQTDFVRIGHYNPTNGNNTVDKSVVNVAVFRN